MLRRDKRGNCDEVTRVRLGERGGGGEKIRMRLTERRRELIAQVRSCYYVKERLVNCNEEDRPYRWSSWGDNG